MAGFLSRDRGPPTRDEARMAAQPANPSLQSALFFPGDTPSVLSGFVAWISRILGRKGSHAETGLSKGDFEGRSYVLRLSKRKQAKNQRPASNPSMHYVVHIGAKCDFAPCRLQ